MSDAQRDIEDEITKGAQEQIGNKDILDSAKGASIRLVLALIP